MSIYTASTDRQTNWESIRENTAATGALIRDYDSLLISQGFELRERITTEPPRINGRREVGVKGSLLRSHFNNRVEYEKIQKQLNDQVLIEKDLHRYPNKAKRLSIPKALREADRSPSKKGSHRD